MSNDNTMKTAEVITLANLTDYVPDSIISKTLVRNDAGNLTYMAFGAGQGLSPHQAPFDAFVTALDGKATVIIDEQEHELNKGDAIIMPANIPHAIKTTENFKMLLVMLKNQG